MKWVSKIKHTPPSLLDSRGRGPYITHTLPSRAHPALPQHQALGVNEHGAAHEQCGSRHGANGDAHDGARRQARGAIGGCAQPLVVESKVKLGGVGGRGRGVCGGVIMEAAIAAGLCQGRGSGRDGTLSPPHLLKAKGEPGHLRPHHCA